MTNFVLVMLLVKGKFFGTPTFAWLARFRMGHPVVGLDNVVFVSYHLR
jgi:hypothetical protein